VKCDPAPDFSATRQLPMSFRPLVD
jgi:hypothetical protein